MMVSWGCRRDGRRRRRRRWQSLPSVVEVVYLVKRVLGIQVLVVGLRMKSEVVLKLALFLLLLAPAFHELLALRHLFLVAVSAPFPLPLASSAIPLLFGVLLLAFGSLLLLSPNCLFPMHPWRLRYLTHWYLYRRVWSWCPRKLHTFVARNTRVWEVPAVLVVVEELAAVRSTVRDREVGLRWSVGLSPVQRRYLLLQRLLLSVFSPMPSLRRQPQPIV